MRKPSFNDAVGAALAAGALLVVAYAALVQAKPEAVTAMVGLLGVAASYFLRGRMQPPAGA